MEATELEDVASSPSSPVVESKSDEAVEPQNTNNDGEELEPKTPAFKDGSRRRSSLKTPANNDKETSKTSTAKSSNAKTTKSAETTSVATPMIDAEEAETPNSTIPKKRGRPSKSSLATPVDADAQTPKLGSKTAEGKKKKITATPAIKDGNDVESPDDDSTSKKTVETPMKDDETDIPNGTITKKRGRPSKSSLAVPVDADVETPKGNKPAEGKKKKIAATPAIKDGIDVDSPDIDSSTPEPTAVKKKKSLISNKKADLLAQEENDDDLAAVTPNASVAGDPKARGRKKSVGIAGTEEPLFSDDRLPEGWSRILVQRQGGATAGKYDVYIMNPENKRFRSRNELRNFITKKALDLQADDFDFSVCGKDLKTTDTDSPIPSASVKKAMKKKITDNNNSDADSPIPTAPVKKAMKKKITDNNTADTDSPILTAPVKKAMKRKSVAPKATTKATPPPKKAKMKRTKLDSSHIISDRPDDASLSPYFSDQSESKRPHSVLRMKPLISTKKWTPPRSPYNLVQENLFHNPWQLLVATILLNKSYGRSATPIIYALFDKWPTAEAVESADIREMSKLIRPLGLHEKRAYSIKRFSAEFRSREWSYPNELYAIGKYGNDSYRMFCVNEWRTVNPSDTMLIMYKNWMVNNWRALCNNTNNCLGIAAK